MKWIISLLSLINGGFMLLDGIYVLMHGKYIGPEKPGPWANLFYALGFDVFKLGPLFIVFGTLWLLWLLMFWKKHHKTYTSGIVLCILTLWYLPFGTLISVIVGGCLVFGRKRLVGVIS